MTVEWWESVTISIDFSDLTAARTWLQTVMREALSTGLPSVCVPQNLPEPPAGRTVVVGAGKASAAMARALETHWSGPLSGLVVTRYGHGVKCEHIEIVEAAHPVPDQAGMDAARRILALAHELGPDDLLICLISGGGSALLALPADGLTLADKQAVNSALLRSGATIGEMNTVRRHLSAVKGGRLAEAAAPARVEALLISDVPGDDPAVIASGPTAPDPTTLDDVHAVIRRYGLELPPAVAAHLEKPEAETPKPGDRAFDRVANRLVARPMTMLQAAARMAENAGVTPLILGDALEGESREVGTVHAGIARSIQLHGQPVSAPALILSGGETTVTVRGNGRGGRNSEFLAGIALALQGQPGILALAADTDGIDGSEDNAGGVVDPGTLERARAAGLDAAGLLADNNAYDLLEATGDLVVTGPTLTNLNDFRAVLVLPAPG